MPALFELSYCRNKQFYTQYRAAMLQTVPVGGLSGIAEFSLGYDISLVELLVQQMQAYPEAGVLAFELLFDRIGSTKIR